MSNEETGLCIACMSPMEGDGVCPLCGYDNNQPNAPNYLQPGTVLSGRYAVGALHSRTSGDAVYKGYDGEADGPVWIVEYFPTQICQRDEEGMVTPLPGYGAHYKGLMSDFIDICNAVKRLSVSDSVIPIENVLSVHNTVYAIYKDIRAITLEEYLAMEGGRLSCKKAVRLFLPLCDTLSNMHARGDIHRGISPQTVYIGRNGKMYLWGFALSAVRTGDSELEAELFNGYSAPEQYASNGWQGPWTDVYALAALFYRTVSGVVPPKSTLVGAQRIVAPLKDLVDDIPESISDAISDAMSTAAGSRTQTMGALSASLSLPDPLSSTAATAIYDRDTINNALKAEQGADPVSEKRQKKESENRVSAKYVFIALLCTVMILGGVMWFVTATYFPDLIGGEPVSASSSQSSEPESSEPEEESSQEELTEADKKVPLFVGLSAENIVSDEKYKDRFEFTIEKDYNDNYPEGHVYDQSPYDGSLMANKGMVILYVSKGKLALTMPDLRDKTLEEAQEILEKLEEEHEIQLPITTMERYDSAMEPGKIISTMPIAGEEFNPKDTPAIFIYVSLEPDVSEAKESSTSSKAPKQPSTPKKDPNNPERDM